jgi:hypothetical protein
MSVIICLLLLGILFQGLEININMVQEVKAAKPGWMEEVNLTNGLENLWGKDIAVWENYVHVVWCDNYAVFYKRSTDHGLNWSDMIELDNSSYYQETPQIAVHDNYVHVVWDDGNINYIKSLDYGENWSTITVWDWTTYPPSGPDSMQWPDVAINDSYVYIVCNSWGTGLMGVFPTQLREFISLIT